MTSDPPVPLFEARGIFKSFRAAGRDVPVLEDIHCKLPSRAVSLVTGRSGEGKSTLLSLLAGLDRPDSGELIFHGELLPTSAMGRMADWRRNRVGVLFQHFNLLPSWTVLQNIEAALIPGGMARGERLLRAHEWLGRVGLDHRHDHLPSQLSVGQQQLAALARVMAAGPEVILADEPCGDVDPETGEAIQEHLLDFVRSGKGSLVVASHGTFPQELADCVFDLRSGALRPRAQTLA